MKLLRQLLEQHTLATIRKSSNPKVKLSELDKEIKALYAQEREIKNDKTIDDSTRRARLAVVNRRIEKAQMKKEKPYDRSKNLKRRTKNDDA